MLMQMMLKDKPYDVVRGAFEEHLRNSPNMPTPHDILGYIDAIELREQERNTPKLEVDPYCGMGEKMWKRLQFLRKESYRHV